jgi:hypothetical protein
VGGPGGAVSTVYAGARPASPARTQLLAATSRMPPISLAQVLEHAALDTRTDLKYVLPLNAFPALLARLGPGLRVLEIHGRRMFGYRSVYFDTPDLLSYRQHLQGNRRRFKVRTRTYLDSADCVLEVKIKGPRSATVKYRTPHPVEQPYHLGGNAYRFIEGHIRPGHVKPLYPVLATSYHRLTLVDLAGGTRITCDADLILGNAGRSVESLRDRLLVETKAVGSNNALAHTFHRMGMRPVTLSKYCLAVAMLAGNVCANPWHRTLRRHFAGVDLTGASNGSGSAFDLNGAGPGARR